MGLRRRAKAVAARSKRGQPAAAVPTPARDARPSPPAAKRTEPANEGQLRLDIFRTHLATLRPGRFLDLATGHGKFALIAKELGWDVTAMDVRDERMPKTPGISWVVADVRDFDVSGYDCIANLGLLYHLEIEDVLSLLKRCAPTPMILDTHFSLRPTQRKKGYAGEVFREVKHNDPELLKSTPTASWGNPTSFWPTEEALLMMLRKSGYRHVFRLAPSYRHDRTFFWCI